MGCAFDCDLITLAMRNKRKYKEGKHTGGGGGGGGIHFAKNTSLQAGVKNKTRSTITLTLEHACHTLGEHQRTCCTLDKSPSMRENRVLGLMGDNREKIVIFIQKSFEKKAVLGHAHSFDYCI